MREEEKVMVVKDLAAADSGAKCRAEHGSSPGKDMKLKTWTLQARSRMANDRANRSQMAEM